MVVIKCAPFIVILCDRFDPLDDSFHDHSLPFLNPSPSFSPGALSNMPHQAQVPGQSQPRSSKLGPLRSIHQLDPMGDRPENSQRVSETSRGDSVLRYTPYKRSPYNGRIFLSDILGR
jgi:hypothetical protein